MTSLSFKTLTVAAGVASLAALYSVSALAEDIGYPSKPEVFQSTKTRDEVRAEYMKAVKDGTLPQVSEISAPVAATSGSGLTREAVIADTLEWLRVHRNDIVMGGN
jgi:phospholipase C